MDYGNKSNAELLDLLAGGELTVGDIAFSKDFNETVKFNGIIWVSFCNCNTIGQMPICFDASLTCEPVTDASAEIIPDEGHGDYSPIDYSPFDYKVN